MLLCILSFNERIQMVPIDSWIINIFINCNAKEIGLSGSDFVACCVPTYFVQSSSDFDLWAFFSSLFRCLIASSDRCENQGGWRDLFVRFSPRGRCCLPPDELKSKFHFSKPSDLSMMLLNGICCRSSRREFSFRCL